MTAPAQPIPEFILALLIPIFMAGGMTDIHLARDAAIEMISAYKSSSQEQLLSIVQIVGFTLTALDNLRLSAPSGLSLSMKLKLRANANGLNQAAQRSTVMLEKLRQQHQSAEAVERDDGAAEAEALASLQQVQTLLQPDKIIQPAASTQAPADTQPAAELSENGRKLAWATVMTDVATECSRDLNKLPPSQRRAEIIRIGALSATARQLTSGAATNQDLGSMRVSNESRKTN